jgi:hypothetical protein
VADRLPFLYALQFCPEDRTYAMGLARLIADLEPAPQTRMAFAFCPRFDTMMDPGVEMYVRNKFPDTRVLHCVNHTVGWPKGPNAMAHELYSRFHFHCHSERPDRWNYCAILMGEPDCVPLRPGWVEELQNEWYECNWAWPLGNRQHVLGCWLTKSECDCAIPHINGNCMISPDFLSVYPAFRMTNFGAWDTTHSVAMLEHGRPSRLILSDYGIGGQKRPWTGCSDVFKNYLIPPESGHPLAGQSLSPCYLHGVKQARAQQCVRDKFSLVATINPRLNPPR